MRKLSESVFDDIISRSKGNEIRNEDRFDGKTNIDKMEEVSINGQIWASDLLEIKYPDNQGPKLCFSYNDIKEIPPYVFKEWRLPTEDDFLKLHLDGYVYHTSCDDITIYEKEEKQGHHLTFENSFVYMMEENKRGDNVVHMEYDEAITAYADPKKNTCKISQYVSETPILVMLIKK